MSATANNLDRAVLSKRKRKQRLFADERVVELSQSITTPSTRLSRKVAEKWPEVGFWAQKREPFWLPKSFISNKKCSKEDSNLHGLPH